MSDQYSQPDGPVCPACGFAPLEDPVSCPRCRWKRANQVQFVRTVWTWMLASILLTIVCVLLVIRYL